MIIIDDIIWFDSIVDKLAWKHNVMPSEVEEVLGGDCIIFRKEKGMRKNKVIKDMSINEASDFWDDHDLGEFDDVQKVKGIKFSFKKKKYVGIDMELYSLIKTKAKSLDKAEDTLINEWLSEKANFSA